MFAIFQPSDIPMALPTTVGTMDPVLVTAELRRLEARIKKAKKEHMNKHGTDDAPTSGPKPIADFDDIIPPMTAQDLDEWSSLSRQSAANACEQSSASSEQAIEVAEYKAWKSLLYWAGASYKEQFSEDIHPSYLDQTTLDHIRTWISYAIGDMAKFMKRWPNERITHVPYNVENYNMGRIDVGLFRAKKEEKKVDKKEVVERSAGLGTVEVVSEEEEDTEESDEQEEDVLYIATRHEK